MFDKIALKAKQKKAEQQWMYVELDVSGKGSSNPPSTSRKSWAEMVEEKMGMPEWKRSVWDDFDSGECRIQTGLVCYVLGAHPPFNVLKGYIQRLGYVELTNL